VSPRESQAQQLARIAKDLPALRNALAAGAVPGKPIRLSVEKLQVDGVAALTLRNPSTVEAHRCSFGQLPELGGPTVDQNALAAVRLRVTLTGSSKCLLRIECVTSLKGEYRLTRNGKLLVTTPADPPSPTDVVTVFTLPASGSWLFDCMGRAVPPGKFAWDFTVAELTPLPIN
jgi:hypothetical protein